MTTRVAAHITGRVQGVGFRPVVYRYATRWGLRGFVRNDPAGVVLEVEGEVGRVGGFFRQLANEPPQQAVIDAIRTETLPAKGYAGFSVLESGATGEPALSIPPDLATCDDCLQELLDPADRRHGYPFLNCTNCGPRFTIIRDLPYDRAHTSMAGFTMCPACDREYHAVADRRFHAQPDACPVCGPELEWKGERVEGLTGARTPFDPLEQAIAALRAGRIVAIKSLGGYHLAGDALNRATVQRLRDRKHRPHKPLAVMFRDLATIEQHCAVSDAEQAELVSAARPIVILQRLPSSPPTEGWRPDPVGATGRVGCDSAAAHPPRPARTTARGTPPLEGKLLSPDAPTLGAFLPYTPLHHLLLASFDALVMTSGNLADEPIVSDEAELPVLLGPIAEAALIHDRPIAHKCDDSVLRVINGQRQFIRRARGYVPNPIKFAPASPPLLAVGGELKSTFCLARDGWAFVSQHLGDLAEYRTYAHFERELAEWQRLLRVTPEAIAHDLHPGYRSTQWARNRKNGVLEYGSNGCSTEPITPALQHSTPPILIPVQHHHAHIASVLAEHNLDEPVIGVALDGTGYGADGTIWGGEFLLATCAGFERVAHFKTYRLPGGDQAIREPWRMAVSVAAAEEIAVEFGSAGALSTGSGPAASPSHVERVREMVRSRFNAPLTSSAGRLFDAVAALLGLADTVTYEAQAAIRLEHAADPRVTDAFGFTVRHGADPWVIDFGDAIRAVARGRQRGLAIGTLAARFHNAVADAVVAVCGQLRETRGLAAVALSGGVWQNAWLLRRVTTALQRDDFRVYTNTFVPPNDGGLALGQVAVAAALLANGEWANGRTGETARTSTSTRNQPCV